MEQKTRSNDRTEEALRRSEAWLAGILSIAADAIISIDARQTILLFNEGAEKIFGYRRDEVVGQPLARLIPARFRGAHDHHISHFSASNSAARRMGERGEIYALRKDGREFPAEASISKLDIDGEVTLTVVLRDITERKAQEAALRESKEELETRVEERTRELREEMTRHQEAQTALARLQRMEALGQLTGGVAHDFNNLLTVISGNLQLMSLDIHDPRLLRYLEEAERAAEMGARLNQRLMTFAKQRRLAPTAVNLNDQVIGVRELLRRSLGETISLATELADDLWTVNVDPSEIENALINLAINARDAMPDGGKLTVTTENVEITTPDAVAGLAPGAYVRLSVSDTGAGMTPEVMARAFEPFFTTKEQGRGTGLGLSTIYGFVRQSGGHVALTSKPGYGTTVDIYLSRLDTAAAKAPSLAGDPGTDGARGETILVVEDNAEVRKVTAERIRVLGYRVIEAENGPRALSILEASHDVDLVFSDVVMPGGLSGFELARRIRDLRPALPVLLTSGFSRESAGAEGERFEVLGKPYSQAALARALSAALDRAKAQPRSTSAANT